MDIVLSQALQHELNRVMSSSGVLCGDTLELLFKQLFKTSKTINDADYTITSSDLDAVFIFENLTANRYLYLPSFLSNFKNLIIINASISNKVFIIPYDSEKINGSTNPIELTEEGEAIYLFSSQDQWAGVIIKNTSILNARISNLEDIESEVEIFKLIESGTEGTVTIPEGAIIVLDQYEDAKDCLIVNIDTNQRPIDDPARDSSGNIIYSTFNLLGNYSLTGNPSVYPIAIIFQVKIKSKDKGNIPLWQILDSTEIPSAEKIIYGETSNVETELDKIQSDSTLTLAGLILPYTPGSILYAGADGLISQDNTYLFYDSAIKQLKVRGLAGAVAFKVDNYLGYGITLAPWTNTKRINIDPTVPDMEFYFGRNVVAKKWLFQTGNIGIGNIPYLTDLEAPLTFLGITGEKIRIFQSGTTDNYGIGIRDFEMQFYVPDNAHYSWNKGGVLQTSGINELMRLDATTGKLALGSSDVSKGNLSVTGNPVIGGIVIFVIDNTTGSIDDRNRISFKHNNNEQAYIQSRLLSGYNTDLEIGVANGQGLVRQAGIIKGDTGYVGFGPGLTNPASSLHIYSSTSSGSKIKIQSSSPIADENSIQFAGSTFSKTAIIAKSINDWYKQNLYFCLNLGDNNNEATTADAQMMIQGTTGYVGIKTLNPLANLDANPTSITTTSYTRPFPLLTTTQRNNLLNTPPGAGIVNSDSKVIDLCFNGAIWEPQKSESDVYVNNISDLPAAIGGKITLADYTRYIFTRKNTINLNYELVIQNGAVIENAKIITSQKITIQSGAFIFNSNIEYTGTGYMFESANTIFGAVHELNKVFLTANNATFFNLSSSQPAIFILDKASLKGNGNSLGTINNFSYEIKDIAGAQLGPIVAGFIFNNNSGSLIKTFGLPNGMGSPGTMFTWGGTSQAGIALGELLLNNSSANVYAYKFDTATIFTKAVTNIGGYVSDGTKAFAASSYNQKSPGFTFTAVDKIPDTNQVLFVGIDSYTPISAADITIDYVNRIVTINPPLGYFYFYVDGSGITQKYTKIGAVNFPAFPDVSGSYRFYFDSSGNPQYTTGDLPRYDLCVTVCRILWNSTKIGSAKATALVYEAHENTISWIDHLWKHSKFGTIWSKGGDLICTPTTGSPASSGVNTCVGMTSIDNIDDNLLYTITNSTGGGLWQQDLGVIIPANLTTANAGIMDIPYMAGGILPDRLPGTRFPFDWNTGTNIPNYITSAGVRTPVSNLYFFVYFIFALQDPRYGKAIMSASTGAEYSTPEAARAVDWDYMKATFSILNDKEIVKLYKGIWLYKTIFPVEVKYSTLYEYKDLRE